MNDKTQAEIENEAEQGIIASLLHNHAAIMEIDLKPSDFIDPLLGSVFAEMQSLMSRQGHFNLGDFLPCASFERFRQIDGGETSLISYLQMLVDNAVTRSTSQIIDYARAIIEYRKKRRLIDFCNEVRFKAGEQSYAEICDNLHKVMEADTGTEALKPASEVHSAIIKNSALPAECYKTGIDALDYSMGGGLYKNFTYGFCGAEKSGKTTLAHTLSYNLAANGCKHLYVALEMGSEQIEQRNIARDMGINSLAFLAKRQETAALAVRSRPRENLWYMDAPGATMHEIMNAVSLSRMKHGITGVIVDYWQLVAGENERTTEEKHLRDVAQGFANYARKHGVWIVLLAQMNKEGKLFGGNGLRKACDQLYMIEQIEGREEARWIRCDASRYTLRTNVGSEQNPGLWLHKRVGPYFAEEREPR